MSDIIRYEQFCDEMEVHHSGRWVEFDEIIDHIQRLESENSRIKESAIRLRDKLWNILQVGVGLTDAQRVEQLNYLFFEHD